MDGNYTLSDIAAVNDSGGFGCGSSSWVLIILFALIFGFGGNGFGANRGDFGHFATAASQSEILIGQQFQNLDNKIDRIGNGIADATFALNNSVTNAASTVGGMVTTEGRNLQAQLSNCCCENQRNVDSVRFDMSNYAAQTQQAIHAEAEATRNMIQQNKIEALQQKVSALELQNAVCGVVRYPMATTYTSGVNPFCACGCGGNI